MCNFVLDGLNLCHLKHFDGAEVKKKKQEKSECIRERTTGQVPQF